MLIIENLYLECTKEKVKITCNLAKSLICWCYFSSVCACAVTPTLHSDCPEAVFPLYQRPRNLLTGPRGQPLCLSCLHCEKTRTFNHPLKGSLRGEPGQCSTGGGRGLGQVGESGGLENPPWQDTQCLPRSLPFGWKFLWRRAQK